MHMVLILYVCGMYAVDTACLKPGVWLEDNVCGPAQKLHAWYLAGRNGGLQAEGWTEPGKCKTIRLYAALKMPFIVTQ
jgi:hypothetical protein